MKLIYTCGIVWAMNAGVHLALHLWGLAAGAAAVCLACHYVAFVGKVRTDG